MEYHSFEQGLRALASHQTGKEMFFGPLCVGLTSATGEQLPFLQLANHHLTLSADEALGLNHIVLDCERYNHIGTKFSMRIEFTREDSGWVIKQWLPVSHSKLRDPIYKEYEMLWPKQTLNPTPPSPEVAVSLGNWRVSEREIERDKNSVGTMLAGERQYCGKQGMQNIPFLHESAFKR